MLDIFLLSIYNVHVLHVCVKGKSLSLLIRSLNYVHKLNINEIITFVYLVRTLSFKFREEWLQGLNYFNVFHNNYKEL